MASKYLNYNKWDKLEVVMLGDCYGADFFRSMPSSSVKTNLQKIADETQEDLQNFETILKQFGCEVIRPVVDPRDKITDFLEPNFVRFDCQEFFSVSDFPNLKVIFVFKIINSIRLNEKNV